MHTSGAIDGTNGTVAMQTRTWTVTNLGGFHGSVHLITADANGAPTVQSETHRYGVDGRWIGTSDRTEAWWEDMGPEAAASTTLVAVFHAWDPDGFETILAEWTAAAKAIGELVGAVSVVATVYLALF